MLKKGLIHFLLGSKHLISLINYFKITIMLNKNYKICANCVMDTTDSKISFDDEGVCDHCNTYYSDILPNWHTDERGDKALKKIVKK